jgi:hypothetical protein
MVTNANSRIAPARNAKISRRGGVRSCGSGRNRRERWIRPFRRTNRAIDSTLRLIALSHFLLNECEIFAGVRPRWATRQMQRVSGRLVEAVARLKRGAESMNATKDCVAHTPEDAGDAPERLIGAMEDWLDAATQIANLSDQIEDTSAVLAAYITSGMAPPLDLDELFRKEGPAPKPIVFRLPSPRVLSIENNRIFCIHVRRQQSVRLTLAEAPRRIFRGRAPPLVSICSL